MNTRATRGTMHRRSVARSGLLRSGMLLLILALLVWPLCAPLQAQERYVCRAGHIWFTSKTPLEDIEAHSREVAGVLTPQTGEMVFQLLVRTFRFPRALMEEHFNENYIESAKYPKSTFKGRIVDPAAVRLDAPGSYDVAVEGDLTIRGVTRKVRQKGRIEVQRDGRLRATARFDVVPQDYGIAIPAAVRDKIATSITINVEMTYERQSR